MMSRGTPVQVEMYPDVLVVRNPGGLFEPVTVDRLGEEGVSSARNATLLQILEDVPVPGGTRTVCEGRDSGIRTMIAAVRAANMSAPEFVDRIGSLSGYGSRRAGVGLVGRTVVRRYSPRSKTNR